MGKQKTAATRVKIRDLTPHKLAKISGGAEMTQGKIVSTPSPNPGGSTPTTKVDPYNLAIPPNKSAM